MASFCEWWVQEDNMQRLDDFLRLQFASVTLLERQADFCRYKVSGVSCHGETSAELEVAPGSEQRTSALSRMFEVVEAAKNRLGIKEYSLSQTSLEQIFNSFARRHAAS
ncbi:hypothetical protein PRIC1_013129 [Phytophthora ramorum]